MIATFLASAAAGAAPPPYPAADVLAAFATACSTAEDTAVNIASATAAGWSRLAPDADTPVTRLAKNGAAAAAQDPAMRMLPGAEFQRQVSGRTLYLAVSGVTDGETTSRGCRLYDFSAPRALTAEEIGDWAARSPQADTTRADGLRKVTFNPGLKPGHMAMEIYHVPAGVQPIPGFELGGLSLVASVMEF